MTTVCLLLISLHLLDGCTYVYTARGVYYRVPKGETLAQVAQKFRVDIQELAEINNIENAGGIRAGRSVYIPGVTPGGLARTMEHEGIVARRPRGRERKKRVEASVAALQAVEVDHGRFLWPVDGEISSLFGMRRGRRHDGVDIRSRPGTPVTAAADGQVVFSKRMRGYGNLVLLKHDDDFFTVYAHNAVNLVKKGRSVKKGETIAKVGRTGRATGPHLHFEVREGTRPRNPLFFLPRNRYAEKARERRTDYGGPEE